MVNSKHFHAHYSVIFLTLGWSHDIYLGDHPSMVLQSHSFFFNGTYSFSYTHSESNDHMGILAVGIPNRHHRSWWSMVTSLPAVA